MRNHRTTKEEYDNIMKLLETNNMMEVSRITGIKWSTIRNYKTGRSKCAEEFKESLGHVIKKYATGKDYLISLNNNITEETAYAYYSFILGLYLGDGCISKLPRTKKLSIYLDLKYEKLNKYIEFVMKELFNKQPYIIDYSKIKNDKNRFNMIEIIYHNCNLGILFPHEGVGNKHLRKIELSDWQKEILVPEEFIKGLMFSDGCFYYDKFNKKYFYNFSNCSTDIANLCVEYLNKIEIINNMHTKKTLSKKSKTLSHSVNVYKVGQVEKLHDLIGDKNNPHVKYGFEELVKFSNLDYTIKTDTTKH